MKRKLARKAVRRGMRMTLYQGEEGSWGRER